MQTTRNTQTTSPLIAMPLSGNDSTNLETNTSGALRLQQEGTSELQTLTSEESQKLTRLVTACYHSLNVYGKTPEQLESVIMLMQMTLKHHPYGIIRRAFENYIQGNSAMPTPHDILAKIKYLEDEDFRELYEQHWKDTPEEHLIRQLGVANYRRRLGVTRKQQPDLYKILDEWEEKNGAVDWDNLSEWREKYKDNYNKC